MSYSANHLGARGGVEPRAFPPSSLRFGLEDRCRERGPVRIGAEQVAGFLQVYLLLPTASAPVFLVGA